MPRPTTRSPVSRTTWAATRRTPSTTSRRCCPTCRATTWRPCRPTTRSDDLAVTDEDRGSTPSSPTPTSRTTCTTSSSHVLDDGEFLEVQPLFAPNVISGFGRIDGTSVGVVANQPMQFAGTLDIDASEKAARFVRTCDCFNVPVLTFVDVPGLPARQFAGVGRHHPPRGQVYLRLCRGHGPQVTVITRKAYGGDLCANTASSRMRRMRVTIRRSNTAGSHRGATWRRHVDVTSVDCRADIPAVEHRSGKSGEARRRRHPIRTWPRFRRGRAGSKTTQRIDGDKAPSSSLAETDPGAARSQRRRRGPRHDQVRLRLDRRVPGRRRASSTATSTPASGPSTRPSPTRATSAHRRPRRRDVQLRRQPADPGDRPVRATTSSSAGQPFLDTYLSDPDGPPASRTTRPVTPTATARTRPAPRPATSSTRRASSASSAGRSTGIAPAPGSWSTRSAASRAASTPTPPPPSARRSSTAST